MNQVIKTVCVLAAAAMLTGCINLPGGPAVEVTTQTDELAPRAEYLSAAAVEATDEGQGETAVESALIWSEKYSEAVEKLVVMQQENRQLAEANRAWSEQNATLQQELKQHRTELEQANEMLLEMRSELDKWKNNVLGFRQEMRQAQEIQLIALRRVLKLLGADVPAEGAVSQANPPKDEGNAP